MGAIASLVPPEEAESQRDGSELRRLALAACEARLVRRTLAGAGVAGIRHKGPLARPLVELLLEDGDSRIRIDPDSGRNTYGCSAGPWPAETIELCSSTAAPISEHALDATEHVREALAGSGMAGEMGTARLHAALAAAVREEVGASLGLLPATTDIVLAGSGTDTELIAVMLALAGGEEPLLSILVAPEESGRGVETAGQGRFFDSVTSLGAEVEKGAPAWPAEACRIGHARIPIRDTAGAPRSRQDVDGELLATAERHLRDGGRVLLHALLGSKTGLRAPGSAVLLQLARAFPGRVDVVVDACQWRCPPEAIRAALRLGWMVQVSGSKFVGGPPFSGALLVPAPFRSRAAMVAARLAPASPITRPGDWPTAWRVAIAPPTRASPGLGALLRWVAATFELALLRQIPDRERVAVLAGFAAAGRARLASSTCLAALPGAPADPSIVALTVRQPDGRPAGLEACQRLQRGLAIDARGWLDPLLPALARLAAREVRIGQPVSLRPDQGEAPVALRLVAGARLLGRVHFDPEGGTLEVRLRRELAKVEAAFDKLELLAGAPADRLARRAA